MKNLILALLKAQKEMGNAKKGSVNPFLKSKYADLNSVREAVMPLLNENNIVVLQPVIHFEGKNFVKTILLHETGECMESLTEILCKNQNDAQAQGSGISYARRYALQSFLCIGADDDDAQIANKEKQKQNLSDSNFNSILKIAETDIEQAKKIANDMKIKFQMSQNQINRLKQIFNKNE